MIRTMLHPGVAPCCSKRGCIHNGLAPMQERQAPLRYRAPSLLVLCGAGSAPMQAADLSGGHVCRKRIVTHGLLL